MKGINQVKETRVRMLIHEYEIFKMEDGEEVEQMFERLFAIVNNFHVHGRIIVEKRTYYEKFMNLSKRMVA